MLLAAADVPTMLVMIILSSLVTAGGMAVVGYFSAPLQAWERLLIFAAGAALVIPAFSLSLSTPMPAARSQTETPTRAGASALPVTEHRPVSAWTSRS